MTGLEEVDMAALEAVCERFGVAELSIFGSAATGRLTPESDIDVLYVLRDGVHLGWAIDDLSDALEQILGRPVDLIARRAIHARLKDSVLGQAKVMYVA
ncbi:MAG: nucleotidyltransferase domain-containing protein [Actinomycetales bacterium]|nr:nucleotidyltransferase domain-containing protein [Actinomycetales bacterium]